MCIPLTTIDCDKSFDLNDVIVDQSLLTTTRRDVCDELYEDINSMIAHDEFVNELIDSSTLINLNNRIQQITNQPLN